jgi:hypothetical protein
VRVRVRVRVCVCVRVRVRVRVLDTTYTKFRLKWCHSVFLRWKLQTFNYPKKMLE